MFISSIGSNQCLLVLRVARGRACSAEAWMRLIESARSQGVAYLHELICLPSKWHRAAKLLRAIPNIVLFKLNLLSKLCIFFMLYHVKVIDIYSAFVLIR